MKKYLIFLLISISVCIQFVEIDESLLEKVEDIEGDENIKKDIFFTIFVKMLLSDEFKENVKEYLSYYPDDIYDAEVLLDLYLKILNLEEVKEMIFLMEEHRNEIKTLYRHESILELLKKYLPNFPWEEIFPEGDIVLKEDKPKRNLLRIIFNTAITVAEIIVPELTDELEEIREKGNKKLNGSN